MRLGKGIVAGQIVPGHICSHIVTKVSTVVLEVTLVKLPLAPCGLIDVLIGVGYVDKWWEKSIYTFCRPACRR